MNLTDLTVSGTNEVSLQNSLNAALLKLKVTLSATSKAPTDDDLIIYVDKSASNNPTDERRKYLFVLNQPLRYFNSVSDELLQEIKIINNDAVMVTKVKRKIGVSSEGVMQILSTPVEEEIEAFPVTLFEGTNYISSNYANATIELIYPKNIDEMKMFLNNAMYHNHKLKNDGEFSLDDIYFKDAFTKTEDKLNLEVNNASVDCITSNNNNFSLDSEGNLIVKTLTVGSTTQDTNISFDKIYPVGSIYMSVNNVNPETLFGGKWEQLKDRFLLGAGDSYGIGTTGGEASHILTIKEMPSHTHVQNPHSHGARAKGFNGTSNTNGYYMLRRNRDDDSYDSIDPSAALSTTATNQNTGEDASHNNMPPYLVVNMWKRVS